MPPRRPSPEVASAPADARPAPPAPAAPAAPAPPALQPPTSSPPPGPFRIQLGAVRDKASAQREWRRLRQKNQDILGGLQLFLQQVNIEGKGVFHRIQAGPLQERVLAELACDQLIARKAACFVIAR